MSKKLFKCPVCGIRSAVKMASGFGLFCGHPDCVTEVIKEIAKKDADYHKESSRVRMGQSTGVGASLGDSCRNDRM